MTDENVQRLEQIHSSEAAAAAAAAKAAPHPGVTPVSRDDDDAAAQVKTNTRDSGQSDVSSWTRDDVTRWLADNQLLSLQNWYVITLMIMITTVMMITKEMRRYRE